jgi:hypothetical protein
MCRRGRSANSINGIISSLGLPDADPSDLSQESEIGAGRSDWRGGEAPRNILSERSHISNVTDLI